MKYNQREIVLVPFPYSDLSALKKRPVVIISNDHFNDDNEDVLVAAITSRIFIDDYSVLINNNDLEYGLLPEQSVIKASKLFTISKNQIVKKFSVLNIESFQKVADRITELINLND